VRYRKPLFYHQRGVFDPERLKFRGAKKRAYIAAVERPLMRRATTLIALTESEQASYRALGVRTPCRIVPNGVDVALYRTTPRSDPSSCLDISGDAFIILFMSRLHPTKGPHKLLEAFALIAREFPHAYLVLAGPDEYGLEHILRARAQAMGLSPRVRFPGMVAGEEKYNLLGRADLFCLPSDAEGFSMATLEAMASGTGVVLSPGCHFPEVEAARAGRIVEAAPGMLARVLRELVAAPEETAQMGRRGRQLVLREYSWERVTDQLVQVYEEGVERAAMQRSR
jgi:glycosyltransferase involved in cell wall biosynthesis